MSKPLTIPLDRPAPAFSESDRNGARTAVTPIATAPTGCDEYDVDRHTIIEPRRRWEFINLHELWRYRELVGFLTWRDVSVRYKQAVLGAAWAIIQPAMLMIVFSAFLGRLGGLSSGDIPYPLFVLTGLLPWTFFANAVGNAGNSVVGSERLITKIYFPRLAIPLSAIGAAAFDLIISLGLLAALMAWYQVIPHWQIVFAPIFLAILVTAAVGCGVLLSALTVAFRDFRFVTPFMIQVGMYATPTIYMSLPQEPSVALRFWLLVNPLVAPIAGLRACILGGPIPWASVGLSAIVAVALLLTGCFYFRSVEDEFADRV